MICAWTNSSTKVVRWEIGNSAGCICRVRRKIITKVDLDGPVLCSEDHILGGAVFNEKDITVSDAPGMGIKGFVPGKVTYLDD